MNDRLNVFTRRAATAIGLAAGIWIVWKVQVALLLAFAGLLLAVFLNGTAVWTSRKTSVSRGMGLTIVLVLLTALVAAIMWLLGPRIGEQFAQLGQQLPSAFRSFMDTLRQTEIGSYILNQAPERLGSGGSTGFFSRITGFASLLLGALTNIVLVLFLGIYFAVDPSLYRKGMLHLIPRPRRDRAEEVFDEIGQKLWNWLMGRLFAMVIVGVLTTVGLMVIGVPLALALGFIAFLLDFILFVGPIAAAIPAVLLALAQSPTMALYTAILYLGVQQIEGNIVTPLVQHEQVQISPALVLLTIVAMGLLFGVLGVIIAVPLTVVILVIVKMLYVEDVLDDEVETVE